jgi:Ran GTPase-activating protein (RanGAP) involved in mRNA processing and transport
LGGILCGLQPVGNISFNFAILISGFASRAECHEQLMQPNSIKNISSLHIYGVNDVLINNDRTLKLAAAFENPVVVSHPGGHFTPNTWPTTTIRQFLIEQQERNTITQPDRSQIQSLNTFEEKLEATISNHQKRKIIPVIPIGLSKPIEDPTIANIPFDDAMLLVWCERTTFHSPEPKDSPSLFFQHWISLYLKNPDQMLSIYLNFIPKYGSWGDIKTLYLSADQGEHEKPLLDKLKSACVKMFADRLRHDQRIVLNQPDESANEQEEQMTIKSQEWISNCAKEAPRLSNNRHNPSTSQFIIISIFYLPSFILVMAKEIAKYMRPIDTSTIKTEKQFNAEKGYAYQIYKRLISSLCHVLDKASPNFVNEQIRSRVRKDRAFRYTKEQREQLLNAPPSTFITNPEPEPVVPCSLDELQPLLEHLILNKAGPGDDNQSIVFSRGAIMTGGRLDLCKQVVGPQGIQPLLNAMKCSSVVNRILLGNNIVGLPGAQAISQYIRLNTDSHIDTWYIAGNHFDSECISLICDALATDTKVKALWLKRNPILATGVVHIARMLTTNQYLQTLDLLNTGLLDEGCEILFNALKSNHSLRNLYIDTNGLTVKSGRIIRLHFEQNGNHLETLNMSCNALGDAGTCEIAAGLKNDKHLKRLVLASNCIGLDGARALVDSLLHHPTLEQLNLGYMKATILLGGLDNVIGDEGATEIARLIRLNQHIRSIDLTFNGISQRGLMQLRDVLKENRILTTLKVLQFGQVHNEITKEEINTMIERNKIEWGRQVLGNDSTLSRSDYLQKGQQLNDEINFPEHVMEIISYYRTH